jgi:hypothetical protein
LHLLEGPVDLLLPTTVATAGELMAIVDASRNATPHTNRRFQSSGAFATENEWIAQSCS